MSDERITTQPRKYTVSEMEAMRRSIRFSYPSGVSYYEKDRAADVENRLRSYMQNGTTPEELEEFRNQQAHAEMEAQKRWQEFEAERRKNLPPPPPPPKTAQEVIDRWFATSVAKYDGASTESDELYDGYMGVTLKRYANRHAPDGVNISQKDMERFLESKGVRYRRAMFKKRYDGICHVISGNVESGNYST